MTIIVPIYRDLAKESAYNPYAKPTKLPPNQTEDQLNCVFHWLRQASTPPAWIVDCYVRRRLGQPEAGTYPVVCTGSLSLRECSDDVLGMNPWFHPFAFDEARNLHKALCSVSRAPETHELHKKILMRHNLWPLDLQKVPHHSTAIVADAQPNPSAHGSQTSPQPQVADLNGESVSSSDPTSKPGQVEREIVVLGMEIPHYPGQRVITVYRELLKESAYDPHVRPGKRKTATPDENLICIFHWLRRASSPPACAVDCWIRRQLQQPMAGTYEVVESGSTVFDDCCKDVLSLNAWLDRDVYIEARRLSGSLLFVAREPQKMDLVRHILERHHLWPLDLQKAPHSSPALVAGVQPSPCDAPVGRIACGDTSHGPQTNPQPQVADLNGEPVSSSDPTPKPGQVEREIVSLNREIPHYPGQRVITVYRKLLKESAYDPHVRPGKRKTAAPDENLICIFHWLRRASSPPACAVDCWIRRQLLQPMAGTYEVVESGSTSFDDCCADVLSQNAWLDRDVYDEARKLKNALIRLSREPQKLDSARDILERNDLWPLDLQKVPHRSTAFVADAPPNASDAPGSAAGGIAFGGAAPGSQKKPQPQEAELNGEVVSSELTPKPGQVEREVVVLNMQEEEEKRRIQQSTSGGDAEGGAERDMGQSPLRQAQHQ